LGERFNGIEEVVGSIPSGSTKFSSAVKSIPFCASHPRDDEALACRKLQDGIAARREEASSAIFC
jgi:hypothetical protein